MHSFFVVPTTAGTGLSSICMGLVRALDQLGIRVGYFKPISQSYMSASDPSLNNPFLSPISHQPIALLHAQKMLAQGKTDQLMEEVLENWQQHDTQADVVIVEGLVPQLNEEYIDPLNQALAQVLGSDIILVAAKLHFTYAQLNQRIELTAGLFGGANNPKLVGCILNKVGAPAEPYQRLHSDTAIPAEAHATRDCADLEDDLPVLKSHHLHCLGAVNWNPQYVAPRCIDVMNYLGAKLLNPGQIQERRVLSLAFIARTVPNILPSLKPGALLVTPGDRDDILLAAALAELNGVPLAGLIFTGGLQPTASVLQLCASAFANGLPCLTVTTDTLETAQWLNAMNTEIPADDSVRQSQVMEGIAQAIDAQWLAQLSKLPQEVRLSPPAFRYQLMMRAQKAKRRIVLPEGEEPRTLQAAVVCAQKCLAQCVLLGERETILRNLQSLGLELPPTVEIIEPKTVRNRYVSAMVSLRAHKGVTAAMAEAMLEDNVVLGTMMLAQNEVDGLVSGALHTTANTIRPALQLIKTKPDATLVSSVFFMLLPEQALVYGDCAVNPNPSAQELADIAIQSAATAKAFGIDPRIAMISYSTGMSGGGEDVAKVRLATQIAQQKRPDLVIDGPLQYDAATSASVAKSKAPDSAVAGRATVFVFPDLNTGNTTYKAVQRSAHVVSIGPVLQGLRKPVNDLSRGASVEDIVYTIAITAIQAGESQ